MDTHKKHLLTRKAELTTISEDAKDSSKPVELDQASVGRLSRMDAMQMQSMALATEERRQAEIKRIDHALKLIEEDDYGYCIACDEEISEKRLEHDPSILTCIKCAK